MTPKEKTTLNGGLYQARKFAELAGVTVRTLHHYDRLGLLKPSGRTTAGYRLYSERELVRLQQIATLKFVGFSLTQTKELLDARTLDLGGTLRMQRDALEARRRQLDLALDALSAAERRMQAGRVDWDALRKVIEVLDMQQNTDWMKKYYSDEARADLDRRNDADPDAATRGQKAWAELLADIDSAIKRKVDPASAEAAKLAERWSALIRDFTGGNAQVAEGLKKLYADQKNWPSTFKKPYSDAASAFICAAQAAHTK